MALENNQEKIDDYLNDLLSAAEKQAFEAELQVNPMLQEELVKHQLEREAIDLLLKKEFGEKIKEASRPIFEQLYKEEQNQDKGGNFFKWPPWTWGLLGLVGIVVAGYFFLKPVQDEDRHPSTTLNTKQDSVPEPTDAVITKRHQEQPVDKVFADGKKSKTIKTGDIDPTDGYAFMLEQPKQDTLLRIPRAATSIDLRLKGRLSAVALPNESFSFEVLKLDEAKENELRILPKTQLLIKRSAEEEEIIAFNQDKGYDFDFNYLIPAEKGRYLLRIWLGEKIVHVERFRVE